MVDSFPFPGLANTLRAARQQNTAFDDVFYDTGNLTPRERTLLQRERWRKGQILVVQPHGEGVTRHASLAHLRAHPAPIPRRFAIAGVGSSDVGAASLARTVANRFHEPVGAIVAGDGVHDVVTEAMDGWFWLGSANRELQAAREADSWVAQLQETAPHLVQQEAERAVAVLRGQADVHTLLHLLLDPSIALRSLTGHSKGCLAIALAIEALLATGHPASVARAKKVRIMTVGAVVSLPLGFDNIAQYLGALDWFGGLNSRVGVPFSPVPFALHHLNTRIPYHTNLADLLASEPG